MHIDIDGALNTSAAGFGHAAPVFERIRDQRIGWDGRNGFVPVLDFDRGQCHFKDVSISPVLGHLDPVPTGDHPVG